MVTRPWTDADRAEAREWARGTAVSVALVLPPGTSWDDYTEEELDAARARAVDQLSDETMRVLDDMDAEREERDR